jgi:TonB family protein
MEARYTDYVRMCKLHGGTLVDGQATHLGKRFRPASGVRKKKQEKDGRQTDGPRLSGTAYVGVVIGEDGKPLTVSLIGTSGNEAMDKQAIEEVRSTYYVWPGRLDKVPVKSYEAFIVFPIICPSCDA